MINEYIQMLLGAYHEYINPDYHMIDYFDSIIIVMGLGALLVGTFGLMLLMAWTMYKGIYKAVDKF